MKRKIWLLIMIALVFVAALAAAFFLPRFSSSTVPSITLSPSLPVSPSPTALFSPSQTAPATDWDGLPTVTPPGPGEPTLPPEAQAMQAAPTATPSPIPPPPSPTQTPTPTPTPIPATGSDDVEMVEVPAGEFAMGSTHQQVTEHLDQNSDFFRFNTRGFLYDQTPQLTIYLDTFAIDRVEVTVDRYRRCMEASICQPVAALETLTDDYPVVGVTWYDADTYCRWVGKRLPTEAEWEKATRGTDGRWYPWGNEWDENRANEADYIEDLKPVGFYPEGASPYGVLDMGGNAPEWTADPYGPYPGQPDPTIFSVLSSKKRVVRGRQAGLAYRPAGPSATATNRSANSLDNPREGIIGFRCVQGPEQDWRNQVLRTSLPPTPAPMMPDLSQMVYVPAGEFIMGSGTEQNSDTHIGSPAHIVYLDAFYIDRYETTVAEYAAFLNTLGSNNCEGYPCAGEYQGQVRGQWNELVDGRYQAQPGFEDRPTRNVSWWGARAYCHWRGKRLPTETEWEKAARGTDGRLYPWGNNWEPERAALYDIMLLPGTYPLSVGTHPGDIGPYGAYDMLGNAEEWVADWYSPSYYLESPYANPQGPESGWEGCRITRGPAASISQRGLILRLGTPPWHKTGFRCTYTP